VTWEAAKVLQARISDGPSPCFQMRGWQKTTAWDIEKAGNMLGLRDRSKQQILETQQLENRKHNGTVCCLQYWSWLLGW